MFLATGWLVPVRVVGSSMAPHLVGDYCETECEHCGRQFPQALEQAFQATRCPKCRLGMLQTVNVRPGHSLLLDRSQLLTRSPKRWQRVVARSPVDASRLVVKRILGLPGEKIRFSGGDLYVNDRLVCKTLDEQRSLRVLIPNANLPGHLAKPTDDLIWNPQTARKLNPVHDLMLTAEATLPRLGMLDLRFHNGQHLIRWQISLEDQQTLLSVDKKTVVATSLRQRLEAEESLALTLSTFDQQVLAEIGSDFLLQAPLSRKNGVKSQHQSLGQPRLEIDKSSGVEIAGLQLWRDVYYERRSQDFRTENLRGRSRRRKPTDPWQVPAASYFVVGDNQAISDDSRSWAAGHALPERLILGVVAGSLSGPPPY